MTTMTKEELVRKVAELEMALETEKAKSVNMKTRVQNLLDSGVNSIDQLASLLGTSNKNISSVLTGLRKEFNVIGKTIITQQFNGKSMVAVVSLHELGWLSPVETTETAV